MSDLIVIAFDNQDDAFAVRQDLAKAQSEYLVELEDAVVVTRPDAEHYQLHQAANLTAAGALGGGFWGGLIGLLFLNPLLGAAVGAGAGALAGNASDYGINDDFIRQIGKTVPVGSGAVFILSRKMNLDKLLSRLERYGSRARVIQTSLGNEDEARLRSALSGGAGQAVNVPHARTGAHKSSILAEDGPDSEGSASDGPASDVAADPSRPPRL